MPPNEYDWFNVTGNFEEKHAVRLSAITMLAKTKSGYRVHLQGESFNVGHEEGAEILKRLGWTSEFSPPAPPPPPPEEKKPEPKKGWRRG